MIPTLLFPLGCLSICSSWGWLQGTASPDRVPRASWRCGWWDTRTSWWLRQSPWEAQSQRGTKKNRKRACQWQRCIQLCCHTYHTPNYWCPKKKKKKYSFKLNLPISACVHQRKWESRPNSELAVSHKARVELVHRQWNLQAPSTPGMNHSWKWTTKTIHTRSLR